MNNSGLSVCNFLGTLSKGDRGIQSTLSQLNWESSLCNISWNNLESVNINEHAFDFGTMLKNI